MHCWRYNRTGELATKVSGLLEAMCDAGYSAEAGLVAEMCRRVKVGGRVNGDKSRVFERKFKMMRQN